MASQATIRNLNDNREGAYRDGPSTGLITGVAAGTASAGHIWAVRWAPSTAAGALAVEKRRFALITRLRARWFTIAGFTAAQEVLLSLFKLTGYAAPHTGGSAITPSKKRTAAPTSLMTGRIATTGALTAGTQAIDTDPIATGAFSELAAAATVPKGFFELFLSTEDMAQYPIVLAPNEGLLLRNEILMGAGGTARVVVEMDWLEVERY
jgi:hypothetical protein